MPVVKLLSADTRADRMAMLEAENADLREQIARLEAEMFCAGLLYPVEWRLTGTEARLVGVLLSRPFARKDQIMTALYLDLHKDEPDPKIVDVLVCKVRRKLKPFGIVIRTAWGVGYAIDEPMRGQVHRALLPDTDQVEARMTLSLLAEAAAA